MTQYERTKQLETRKAIATGFALLGMTVGALAFLCKMGPCSVDVVIEENEIQRPIETEVVEVPVVVETAPVEVPATQFADFIDCEEVNAVEEDEASRGYSDQELSELAHLIYAEAGNQKDDIGLYYVALVVRNRKNDSRYPSTWHDVIYQKGQYSPTWHGMMKREPQDRCWRIAKEVMDGTSSVDIPEGVLGQAGKKIYKKYATKLFKQVGGNYFFFID